MCRLNASSDRIPHSIFYADDGVLFANEVSTIQTLVDILAQWNSDAKINVNVRKCALLANRGSSDPIDVRIYSGASIPIVDEYAYSGFPIRAGGIDFEDRLRHRLAQANGRAAFLRLQSDDWGPAHRLRVYHQYLAPMFEYGAPLVWAWAEQSSTNLASFNKAAEGWRDLVSWIVTCGREGHGLAANLCGLVEPCSFRPPQNCISTPARSCSN